jgi:hypothetical protein
MTTTTRTPWYARRRKRPERPHPACRRPDILDRVHPARIRSQALLAATLLLLGTASPAPGGPGEVPPETVKLAPAKPPWPRLAPHVAPSDVALSPKMKVLAGTASGIRVLLADTRGDGILDAWAPVRSGQVHWLPLSRPVVLPAASERGSEPREHEWVVAADGKSVRSRAVPSPEVPWSWPKDWGPVNAEEETRLKLESATSRTISLRLLDRVNDLRMRNGLPPGRLAADRSADAFLHALYLARTGEVGHTQKPGRWASAAGAASGMRSGISQHPDPVGSHYFTILHRMILFQRETTDFGFGSVNGNAVLDGSAGGRDLPWSEVGECVPGPFAEGIPLVARDEIPRPHADKVRVGRGGVIGGFPITIRVGRKADNAIPTVEGGLVLVTKASGRALQEIHASLRLLADAWCTAKRQALRDDAPADAAAAADAARTKFLDRVRAMRGEEMPVRISWPGNPCAVVGSDRGNAQAIALLAESPLEPESNYLWWALWTDRVARTTDSPGGRALRMVEVFTTGPAGPGSR